jgi:hypothetical protein
MRVLSVRRSDLAMNRNAEIGLFTSPSDEDIEREADPCATAGSFLE